MPIKKVEPNDICAIIITYHPDDLLPERVSVISGQVAYVIIVDNGSNDHERKVLRNIGQDQAVEIVFNNENLGIAKALNIGISIARHMGYQFSVLFDQDSRAHEGLVNHLCQIYSMHESPEKIALIGANYNNILKDSQRKITSRLSSGNKWNEVKRVITSGSLISLSVYEKIGLFREDFFIDLVDIEYCMRARKLGYIILKSTMVLMTHSIGFPSKHLLLGNTVWTTNHSAIRRYYYARNYVAIQREFGRYILGWWAIKSLKKCIKQCTVIVFFEKDKLDKVLAIALGWWHGLNKKMGKYEL